MPNFCYHSTDCLSGWRGEGIGSWGKWASLVRMLRCTCVQMRAPMGRYEYDHVIYEYNLLTHNRNKTHKRYVRRWSIKSNCRSGEVTYLAQGIPWSSRRFLQVETQALHFAELKLAISPNVGDSGAQFLVGGDCVRASPVHVQLKTESSYSGSRKATVLAQ